MKFTASAIWLLCLAYAALDIAWHLQQHYPEYRNLALRPACVEKGIQPEYMLNLTEVAK